MDAQKKADDDADADNLEVAKETPRKSTSTSSPPPARKPRSSSSPTSSSSRPSRTAPATFTSSRSRKWSGCATAWTASLIDVTPPPKQMQLALASRIKIMSSLDIAERRLPQDGRLRIKRRRQGLRSARLRSAHRPRRKNRAARARQDPTSPPASTTSAWTPTPSSSVKAAVDAPHGLILVTGPTGSGKTTTLYSALNELNSPTYNIVTVEDPVEFQLPGINQVPVKKEIGLTFANALRSILRQDPDIVMIGEIRDTETAEIAVEAALTGHQVLEHHALQRRPRRHRAPGRHGHRAVPDFLLRHPGLRPAPHAPHLLPLQGAGHLHRRRCTRTSILTPHSSMASRFTADAAANAARTPATAGRMAIIEAMTISDEIRKLIIARANTREMGKVAIGQGMRTLRMVALDRVREGISTLEQVLVLTSAQ